MNGLMADIHGIKLRQLHGRLGEIVYQLTRVQFFPLPTTQVWRPAVNAYRCHECIAVCVDLAGIDQSSIQLRVEPRRMWISGRRQPPEPVGSRRQFLQILVMEIDHGPFEREVSFPVDVDPTRVIAESRNGLLWIYLEYRSEA
ncbi:MAG: Hsp20/alpha crystallin family protein [Candidatus Omnitrophica bacterium]|nr:Hsp20/alpha crystallin family protein [Candidatus Omnitrophota bacterium]